MTQFESINNAYNSVFKPNELTVGVVVPIENYAQSAVPTMQEHLKRVKYIEELGFKALWIRDIPFNVPSLGDAGQTYDPFTYLGFLAGQASKIALGVSSIALPLHHPLHVAKSASAIDVLSNGRLLLGVASGDRYDEYPAMGISYENRGELFKESFQYIRQLQDNFPTINTKGYGNLQGNIDMLLKATAHKIPLLMTGSSRQTLEWNAEHADGWMNYPRDLYQQQLTIKASRDLVSSYHNFNEAFMQPMYLDLQEDPNFKPQPIQLGFRLGINYLTDYLDKLRNIGVNHLALNLRFNTMVINTTLELISKEVLPEFH